MSEFDPLLTAEAVGYREAKIVGILANDEHSGNTLFRDLNPALVDVSPLRYEEFCRCPPRRFRFSGLERILYRGAIHQGGHGRMADADQQQAAPCDEVVEPFESTAAAVSLLFREHNAMLMGYLTARLRSEQEAKEVAQEAYVRLLKLQEPGTPSSLRGYLFKTATNIAIDRLRHRSVQHRWEEQPELFEDSSATRGESNDPAKLLLAREQADQLLGYLQELPIKCQHVINLHRLEGLPQHAVAVRLRISERMVRRYVTYTMVYCHLRLDGMAVDQVRQRVSL
jgi:RNA polymerase sigma-70 factor (ECF subfamily)